VTYSLWPSPEVGDETGSAFKGPTVRNMRTLVRILLRAHSVST
jgi:hypothetical protein